MTLVTSWSPAARATTSPARSSRSSPPAAPGSRAGRTTRRLVGDGAVLALSAAFAWPALVPVLPTSTYADSFCHALDDDQPETIGWPEYAAQVRAVVADLPDGAVVFTGNYGEAGAFEWYGVGAPGLQRPQRLAQLGPAALVRRTGGRRLLRGPLRPTSPAADRAATLHNDLGIDNEEEGHGVWVCDGPIGGWSKAWRNLSHYDA